MLAFYLDDYNLIKAYGDKSLLNDGFKVLCNGKDISFCTEEKEKCLFIWLNQDYVDCDIFKVCINNNEYEVIPRFIVQTDRFDQEYKIDLNKLGCFIEGNKTTFRLWSPLSIKAYVVINNQEVEMVYLGNGLFEKEFSTNLEYSTYHYKTLREKLYSFTDPFSYLDKENESYVLDYRKMNYQKIVPDNKKKTIIYELNVRDFSSRNQNSFIYPKKLLALKESGVKLNKQEIGFDYLKKLGITHIQLMPIFSFDLDGKDYNWGYNPLTFNTIDSSYLASNDPYKCVGELRNVVNYYHLNGLRVNLDVVYNHVYKPEKFNLCKMLPYYFLRYKDDEMANGSYCGNETRSESYFLRNYLLYLLKRFIEIYDIDGLRFDLMGLIDLTTIKQMAVLAKTLKEDFMVYGEGWNMGDVLKDEDKAIKENAKKLEDVAFFNDYFRETLRGKDIDDKRAYLLGEISLKEKVKDILNGSVDYGLNNKQSINYIDCHDNYIFYDKVCRLFTEEYLQKKISKLALSLICISKGLPFIHSGQEFLRSKNAYDNTYDLGDDINGLDWSKLICHKDVSDYFSSLLKLRQDVFTNDDSYSFEEYYEVLIVKYGDIRIFINPCIFDHIYASEKEYELIFDENGFINKKTKDFKISSFSIVVGKMYNEIVKR